MCRAAARPFHHPLPASHSTVMDPKHELASKDCRVCNRRRIKCDRRLPSCGKCEKRGLTCSGYGVILKWNQGVASRGNLKGKSLPLPSAENASSTSSIVPGAKSLQVQAIDPRHPVSALLPASKLEVISLPQPIFSHPLQSPNEQRLLYHYDHVVAPNMAWADCSENPWRHIIIPLALQSAPLLSAILAFAAKHINAIAFSDSSLSGSIVHRSISDTFQQQAVKFLAQEIHEFAMARPPSSESPVTRVGSRDRLNAILATMLVLCNVETVWPDSPVWQVHLNAARTVMASHQAVMSAPTEENATSTFLNQELFIANTFASTTNFLNFLPNEEFKFDSTLSKPDILFIEFLKLIEMVTNLERQSRINPTLLGSTGVTSSGLRALFEEARSRTLALGKTFQVSGRDYYLHLSRTVNCFYHAGLIYSHRALLKDASAQKQIATSKIELFLALSITEPSKPTFAQDLVWPLFIAGTEATSKVEQEMVVSRHRQAMAETGFSNCAHALEFLDAFWERRALHGQEELDWIGFATEWTREGGGRTFLVF